MTLTRPLTYLFVVAAAAQVLAQSLTDVRQLYDQGKYSEAIAAAGSGGSTAPRLVYLEALSRERLGEAGDAGRAYARLAEAGLPVWKSIAESATARRNNQTNEAVAAADRAVAQDPGVPEAHYQLGLALADSRDFARAAATFDRAAALDPQWAYARYQSGLAYYQVKRIDLLAERFEAFLKLAPNAPERPEVETIMRTLRGR